MKRKGLLMICYYYPPIKSMGVRRSYALSHEWLKYFDRVSIITTTNNKRLESDQLPIDDRLNVKTVSTFDYRTLTSTYSRKSHYTESSKKSWLGQLCIKLLNSFPFNLWLGEGGYWYARNVYREAKRQIKNNNIEYIYSSFRPYADHYVAYKLKKRFPHLKWLADYRDIHVDKLKNNVYFGSYQHRMSRRILSEADAVTTVSKGCAEHIQKYTEKPVAVVYNGVQKRNRRERHELDGRFSITYTGSLYGEMRDPSLVFTALKALIKEGHMDEDVSIVYAGKDEDTWRKWISKYGLERYSEIKGYCSFEESRALQDSSHINLQLTFAHPEVTGAITGKLMEYVQSGRPILCVINGSKDKEIESFFEELDGCAVVYNSVEYLEVVKDYLLEYYRAFRTGEIHSFVLNENIVENFYWESLACQMLKSLRITKVK